MMIDEVEAPLRDAVAAWLAEEPEADANLARLLTGHPRQTELIAWMLDLRGVDLLLAVAHAAPMQGAVTTSVVLRRITGRARQQSWWRRQRRWLVPVAAATLLGALLAGLRDREPATGWTVVAAPDSRSGTTLRAGMALDLTANQELSLNLEDGTSIHLRGPALGQVESLQPQTALRLDMGELRYSGPPRTESLRIITPHGKLRVVGTEFRLHVSREGSQLHVAVGAVTVTTDDGEHVVTAGSGWKTGLTPPLRIGAELTPPASWSQHLPIFADLLVGMQLETDPRIQETTADGWPLPPPEPVAATLRFPGRLPAGRYQPRTSGGEAWRWDDGQVGKDDLGGTILDLPQSWAQVGGWLGGGPPGTVFRITSVLPVDHDGRLLHPWCRDAYRGMGTWRTEGWQAKPQAPGERWEWEHRRRWPSLGKGPAQGMPPELLLATLAEARVEPWLVLPVHATLLAQREFASAARRLLPPDLPLVIEYGHGALDGMNTTEGRWLQAEALGAGKKPIAMLAEHAAAAFAPWREVFASQPTRLRCAIDIPLEHPEAAAELHRSGADALVLELTWWAELGRITADTVPGDAAVFAAWERGLVRLEQRWQKAGRLASAAGVDIFGCGYGPDHGMIIDEASRALMQTLLTRLDADPRQEELGRRALAAARAAGATLIVASDRSVGKALSALPPGPPQLELLPWWRCLREAGLP